MVVQNPVAAPLQLLDRFVHEPEACGAAGVKSRSTLRSMVQKGLFPKPIRVSPGRIAWSAAEIAAWQKARIQERDDDHDDNHRVTKHTQADYRKLGEADPGTRKPPRRAQGARATAVMGK
jgi:prophage regulatory protein